MCYWKVHAASPVKLAKSFAVIAPFVSVLILRIKSKEQSCPLMMRESVAAVVPTCSAKPRKLRPFRSRYILSGCLLMPHCYTMRDSVVNCFVAWGVTLFILRGVNVWHG